MNSDLDKIAEILKKRFPRCEVNLMRSGDHGPNPLVTVFFPSVGDEVFAIGDVPGKGNVVYMGVNEHVKNEDFKSSGYDLFQFQYQGPEHLVGKFVEGAQKHYEKEKDFEDFEDKCDRDAGIEERSSFDPRWAPAMADEIHVGATDALVVEWERETM